MGKEYSYAFHPEDGFHGRYKNIEEAKQEAIKDYLESYGEKAEIIYIGENRDPSPAELFFCVDTWVEQVYCQEDYSSDCAEEWYTATREQEKELETIVQKVISDWLDKHDLRPTHWIVDNIKEFNVINKTK